MVRWKLENLIMNGKFKGKRRRWRPRENSISISSDTEKRKASGLIGNSRTVQDGETWSPTVSNE